MEDHGAAIPGVFHSQGKKGKNKEAKKTWVVSMWNKKKFGNYSVKVTGALESDAGRPFLILAFDKKKVIFINLHNCQPGKGAQPRKSWYGFLHEMNVKMIHHFKEKPERRDYRIIMVGDFNDLEGKLPACLRLPWLRSEPQLTIQTPFVSSCCKSKTQQKGRDAHEYEPNRPGDYIFDSFGPAKNRLPASYQNFRAQSDHRPVEAFLPGSPKKNKGTFNKCLVDVGQKKQLFKPGSGQRKANTWGGKENKQQGKRPERASSMPGMSGNKRTGSQER